MVDAAAREWLKLWTWHKAHVLPFTGGLYDQPNIYLEAMDMIGSAFAAKQPKDDT